MLWSAAFVAARDAVADANATGISTALFIWGHWRRCLSCSVLMSESSGCHPGSLRKQRWHTVPLQLGSQDPSAFGMHHGVGRASVLLAHGHGGQPDRARSWLCTCDMAFIDGRGTLPKEKEAASSCNPNPSLSFGLALFSFGRWVRTRKKS